MTVFEKDLRIGGQCFSIHHAKEICELGCLFGASQQLLDLLKELGVKSENKYIYRSFFTLQGKKIPIKKYLACHKTRVIKPTSGGTAVAINILEATWTDYKTGCKDNAKAGWVLAKNKCGVEKYDPRTGVGPSGWSKDGKVIERVYPFPTEWASLYQTWNICFVTRFEDFLYVMPKLSFH